MEGLYWKRHPNARFATLIRIATTYLHPEADDLESLQVLARREDDEQMRAFKAELRDAINNPDLVPDNELSSHVQYDDASPQAFLRRLWRDLYGEEPYRNTSTTPVRKAVQAPGETAPTAAVATLNAEAAPASAPVLPSGKHSGQKADSESHDTATATPDNGPARRLVIGVDIVRYSARNTLQQDVAQQDLDRLLSEAVRAVGLDRQDWQRLARGDGELAVLPTDVDLQAVTSEFIRQLDDRLAEYNEDHAAATRIRLRVAMHMGMLQPGTLGYAGDALIVLGRLLDAPEFKELLAGAPDAGLALLVSQPVYRSVKQSGQGSLLDHFQPLKVDNPAKGFSQTAYAYIPYIRPEAAPSPPSLSYAADEYRARRVLTAQAVGNAKDVDDAEGLIRDLVGAGR